MVEFKKLINIYCILYLILKNTTNKQNHET